jgi:hypothetical protein
MTKYVFVNLDTSGVARAVARLQFVVSDPAEFDRAVLEARELSSTTVSTFEDALNAVTDRYLGGPVGGWDFADAMAALRPRSRRSRRRRPRGPHRHGR